MRFHFRRAVNFAIIVVGSLIVIHVLSTTTPTYNDNSVVTDSRQLAAVTRKSGNAAMNRTSPTRTAGAWTPVSITAMSTMTPSFRQRVHRPSIRLSAALRAANFSADTNEWHRESVVVRLPSQSSHSGSSNDGKSIWWWGSSPKTTNATLEPPRDRILQQMSYVPESYSIRRQQASNANSVKIIYVPGGGYTFKRRGKDKFEHCLVNACAISTDRRDAATSHMRLLYGEASLFLPSERVKPPGQIWVMYLLESPAYVVEIHNVGDLINWTATFRWDSTIVTPYAKFVPFPYTASTNSRIPSTVKNYAAGKTKMVVWFASNCFSRNKRGEYVEELSRYLPVDVFGMCGKPFCRRKDRNCWLRLRREYKFYLSFENSNCDYYITEKFFDNALSNDVVPVVMGGRRQDYERAAPPHSYIHVEDFSTVRDLAAYLLRLNQSDALYSDYFQWKSNGEFIDTKFWCRLCAMLHDDDKPVMWYSDFNKWWSQPGTCRVDRWDTVTVAGDNT